MHDSALAQKLDQIIQIGNRIVKGNDHLDRLLTRLSEGHNGCVVSPNPPAVQTQRDSDRNTKLQSSLTEKRKQRILSGPVVALVGLASAVCSFFPHVNVSDPVQMDPTDLFSYQMTVSNGGVLPVFMVKWALAPREIKLTSNDASIKSVKLLLPHSADWVASSDLMERAIKPGPERRAVILFTAGSELTVLGPADYEFQIRTPTNGIGTITPGDQFTFTTEGLMSAPPDATYDVADFAVAIKYVPIFPPLPMQTCSHFRIFRDRQGATHWFRATDQCDRFPWLHNWFPASGNARPFTSSR